MRSSPSPTIPRWRRRGRPKTAVMRGDPLGPLHGVPVAVKDLIPTADIRTTWGSLIFKDHVPDHDSVAVARLKQAGAIVVGKTTTPEFGQQCLTQAPLFGRTRNAWRADRSSGGSSGGSAVAVAAGLVPIAVATDGGGSTRIPAACNGVVGFKQGLGVVPQEYAQDGFGNISYVTPMTRTVLRHRADAGCDGRHRPARSADHRPAEGRFRCRDRRERSAWPAHRLACPAWATPQWRPTCWLRAKLPGGIRGARRRGVGADGAVRKSRDGVVRQQWRLSYGAVRPPPEAAPRHHVPDLRAADGPRGRTTPLPNCTMRSSSARGSTVRCRRGSTPATSSPCRRCRAGGADRSGFLRPDRDRQPVGREHPRLLVSLHHAVQPDRQSGGQPAVRLRRRRHAAGDPTGRAPWRRCRVAARGRGVRARRPWADGCRRLSATGGRSKTHRVHQDLSAPQNTGADPFSSPVTFDRHAACGRYCPSGIVGT